MATTTYRKRIHSAIVKRIRRGEHPFRAAEAEGIVRSTFGRWCSQGRLDRSEGRETRWSELVSDVERAEAEAQGDVVEAIRIAAQSDGRIAVQLAERRWPEEWGAKQTINVTTQIDRGLDALEAEFRNEPETLARALRALSGGADYVDVEAVDVTGRTGARALAAPGDDEA